MKKSLLFLSFIGLFCAGNVSAQMTVSISINNDASICTAPCNGSATVQITGGTPPYNIGWLSGQTTQTVTDLCPGSIGVYVLDSSSPIPSYGNASGSISCLTTIAKTFSENTIKILPNPVSGSFSLTFNSNLQGNSKLRILNVIGETIYNETIETTGVLQKDINVSSFAKGVYFIEIVNETNIYRSKFIKE